MLEMFVLNPPRGRRRGRYRRNDLVQRLMDERGITKKQAEKLERKVSRHYSGHSERSKKWAAQTKADKERERKAEIEQWSGRSLTRASAARKRKKTLAKKKRATPKKRTTKKGDVRKTARRAYTGLKKKKTVKRKTVARKPAARKTTRRTTKKGDVRKTARRAYVKKKKSTGRGWKGDTRGHQIAYAIGRSGMGGTRGAGAAQRRKRRTRLTDSFGRGAIRRHRGKHPLKYKRGGKKLRRKTPGIPIRYKTKKRRYTLVANRDSRGRFSGRKRRTTKKGMRRKTARRAYTRNPRGTRTGMRRKTARRAYKRNPTMAASFVDALTAPFDMKFVTETALPVTGGFLLSRFASGMLGGGLMGEGYKGPVRIVGNFAAAGITGFAAGFVASTLKVGNPTQIRGNVILGGMVNAVAGLIKYVLTDVMPVKFISDSPALSSAFGLSGLGYDNSQIRSAVQREVMKELGVSDYLTTQDLGKAQYMGDYLTTQNLAKAKPNTMSGMGDQWFPAEANGGALADFSDVATF